MAETYDTMASAEEYLARLDASLRDLPAAARNDAVAEVRSHISEGLEGGASLEDVLGSLGSAEEYAEAVREAVREPLESPEPQGRLLGVPYDFRGANTERLMSRLWNPADPRILMPRLFGLGWTVNFGALAVRLGVVRPDDAEDDAFDDVPGWAVAGVLAVPALLALVTGLVLAIAWPDLPPELPVHWSAGGRPDGFAPRLVALAMILAAGVAPVAGVLAHVLRPGTPNRTRVLSSAAVSLFAALGAGLAAATVAGSDGSTSASWIWGSLIAGLALSFLVLVVPARLALSAQWRRGLGDRS